MYVVTFYSFKGGVGRTMALVNVGFELARTGRRVLFVDFDLEAPGLETFMSCHNSATPGLVDYVDNYVRNKKAPEINEYISPCTIRDDASETTVWLMNAGKRDSSYGKKLSSIDWKQLYAEHDGYLLMEHLKEEWKRQIQPDYVLIDSRTGYTEEGGICTRQLPDAVVAMFFPNDQNLNGLQSIVRAITKQKEASRRDITLHMVAANIPDLDDEENILGETLERFKETLRCGDLHTIHYYEHMDIVRQTIFTVKHPKTRLALEYRNLVEKIVQSNAEDPAGAMVFLRRAIETELLSRDLKELRDRVARILIHHPQNVDLLRLAADFYFKFDLYQEAHSVLSQILALSPGLPDILARRAIVQNLRGNEESGREDIIEALRSDKADYPEYMLAIHALRQTKQRLIEVLTEAQHDGRLEKLDASTKLALAQELMSDSDLMPLALYLAQGLLGDETYGSAARTDVVLCLIHTQQYDAALSTLGSAGTLQRIQDQFNYAMAEWAKRGIPNRLSFEPVALVALKGQGSLEERDANTHQCFAISCWATGEIDEAMNALVEAERQLQVRPGRTFSAWRYLYVTREEFTSDCKELARMMQGEKIIPLFMRRKAAKRTEYVH